MKVRRNVLISIILFIALGIAQLATPSAAYAFGIVGSGTPESCTEGALDSALSTAGSVTFNCGASPFTFTISGTKTISSDTQIDGGGLITISGGNLYRVFTVDTGATLNLTGITVTEGKSTGDGGGLYLNSGSTATITNSTFSNNNVVDGYGGGIYVNAATLTITNSTFSNNHADVSTLGVYSLGGGAIQNNDGTVTISGSTFNSNSVISSSGDGGAIYNGDFDGSGGTAPDANADTLKISNSTFYNNFLDGDTSGSSGGAIRSNGDITLAHNTFSDNDSGISQVGGGESGAVTFASGTAVLAYNIFANSLSDVSNPAVPYDCAKRPDVTSFTSVGNLIEQSYVCAPLYTSDPILGALQDNGGMTYTMALGNGSNAIDHAGTCAIGITIDQRGVARPQGGATKCDIGAYELDNTAPTITIDKAAGQADPTNSAPVNFTVTFSEPVVNFTTGDVDLSASTVGGTLTGTVTGGPAIFNVAVDGMTTPGNIVASINAGVAADIALNSNVASTSSDNIVAYDATGPSVTISRAVGQNDPTNNATINFTVVFDEAVTGFDETDVTIDGTANPTTKIVTGGDDTYNVAVGGPSGDGTITAKINAGAVNDALGNPSTESNTAVVSYDTTAPTVTINQAATQSDPTGDTAIDFTVVFNEPVMNFATGDVTINGTAGANAGDVTEVNPNDGTTFNVAVTNMAHSGTVIATIAAGVATDLAGNNNAAAAFDDNQVTLDSDKPTATIDRAAGQPDETGFAPANFAVTFSKPVTGFETNDVTVTGTAGVSMIGTVTETGLLDGTTYNIAVSGMTASGTAVVSFPAGAATDGVGNSNFAPTIIDNSVTFTFVKPGIPSLVLPLNGALVGGLQPLLDWNDSVPIAQYYQIQVSAVNTFASTVINETNLITSNFTPISNLTPGVKYFWRVRATNAIGGNLGWSTIRNFSTPLNVPSLSSPIGGVLLNNVRPTFDWNDIAGATSYTLQISASSSFGSILVSRNITGSSYAMNADLPLNKILFWRVAARTSVVTSAWASTQSFKTGNPASIPVLVTPASNALVTILNPLFNWNNSTLPGGTTFKNYHIQVDDNSDFSSPLINKEIAGLTSSQYPSVLADGLATNVRYYWRVQAVNTYLGVDQFSAWSTVFSFRSAMVQPVLLAPANTTSPALTTRRPAFDWEDTNGATGYQLIVSRYTNLSSPLLNVSIGSSDYVPAIDMPANTVLYWHVRATGPNGPSIWSARWTFKSGNPPSVPVLVSPTMNALTTNPLPKFDWNNSTVPTGTFKHYEIQVDDTSDFSTPVINHSTTDGVRAESQYQAQAGEDLTPNTKYYWRVRAISTISGVDHISGWSTVWTVRASILAPQSLTVSATGNPLQPSFDWADATGPITSYTIQISTSSSFSTFIVNSTTIDSSYDTLTILPTGKTIYWRVRVNGANGPSLWSKSQFTLPLP